MRRNKDLILAGVLVIVLSFALFGNGIVGDFVFDDTIVIVGNPLVGDSLKFGEILTTPYSAYQPRPGLYRPLTIASYSLNSFIFGSSPVSFHVVNILLHALASYSVLLLIYRLACEAQEISASQARFTALAGFLLFMFLPIHTEAVTSIVGRAELLSFIFVVGALIFSVKKKHVLASSLFFLGLLSKEMAIAFLPIFLFLEFKNFKKLGYLVPPLILYAILRYAALGEYFLKNDATLVYNPLKFTSFLTGFWTSFKVFYLYLAKTFVPLSLSSDYSFNQIPIVNNPFSYFETLAGIGILALFIFLFFRAKDFLLRFGIIIFLASYLVISNWVFKTGTIMAERLMYTPSLGLAILVAYNFKFKIINFKIVYAGFAILLLWYGFVIIDRNRDWLNNKNLYESAYVAAPNSVVNKTNKAYLDCV